MLLGRQQRRRIPHPLRRPRPLTALLHAPSAPSGGNLRREAAAAGAFHLHLARRRRLGGCGAERLDRRRDASRSGRRSRRDGRHGAAEEICRRIRPHGRGAHGGRLGARRPETRKHRRGQPGTAPPDRFRRHVSARLRRPAQPGAGHGGFPASRAHGAGFRRFARRLSGGPDLHGAACAGARPDAVRPLFRGRRAALHAAEDRNRRGALRGARTLRAQGTRGAVPDCTAAPLAFAPAAGTAATAGTGGGNNGNG